MRNESIPRVILYLSVVVLGILGAWRACEDPVAHGQDNADAELGLALAKVTVNEAGWSSPADMDLIWQTVRGRARDSRGRLRWLREHSSCVLGDSLSTRGNCEWTRDLGRALERPPLFPAQLEWEDYLPRWEEILRGADLRVRRNAGRRVCAETPHTWGGKMDIERAIRLGMRPLGCEGTLNEGFRFE